MFVPWMGRPDAMMMMMVCYPMTNRYSLILRELPMSQPNVVSKLSHIESHWRRLPERPGSPCLLHLELTQLPHS